MSNIEISNLSDKREYTVTHSFSGGVNFSAQEGDRRRPIYMENLYRDYERTGGNILESIPGFRTVFSAGERINGIFRGRCENGESFLVIHSGTSLFFGLISDGELSGTKKIFTVSGKKSTAFSIGCEVFVMDGEQIVKVSEDGTAHSVGSDSAPPHVPTTYYNGTPYEQPNILTPQFCESYSIISADDYSFGSDGIYYRITDAERKTCSVSGTNDAFGAVNVSIPSYTVICGERYSVTEIDAGAFRPGTYIVNLTIGEGVTKIGRKAFAGCEEIEKVYLPSTLSEIEGEAFAGCTSLSSIFVHFGFLRFGNAVFERCPNLKSVFYTSDSEDFSKIENSSVIGSAEILRYTGISSMRIKLPLSKEAKAIKKVTIDGMEYAFTPIYAGVGRISAVLLTINSRYLVDGKEATVYGTYPGAANGEAGYKMNSDTITKCTVCELFDGRVFLSGNPSFPGTVFFSERNLTYDGKLHFGIYNHFTDGLGSSAVVTMLSMRDGIAIFKANDDGDGSIFYHTPKDSGDGYIPTIYPVSYVHSGICAVGESISFYDDPVFLTRVGLCGIDKKAIDYDRSISCRSDNVNVGLLTENLSDAMLTEWCGYLVVAAGEHIYLADSRATFVGDTGNTGYEWYYLCGIGVRKNGASAVYRYASTAPDGYSVHPCPDTPTDKTVMSEALGGDTVLFVNDGDKKYTVYKTEENVGGVFYPLTAITSVDERLLIFGTENGDVCIFNNDKRGIAPPFIAESEGFDKDEYAMHFSRVIHPYYYDFATVSPRYAIKTAPDSCQLPHLSKNTVKHSMALSCTSDSSGLVCEVGTERKGYREVCKLPNSCVDFSYLDFSSLAFCTSERITVPISEKEKNWVEKQISIYSEQFRCPIGVSSVTYRFTVRGRIKKN